MILEDASWNQWRSPAEAEKYATLWIFELSCDSEIQSSKMLDPRPNIKCNLLEILCNDAEKVLSKLKTPPFGKVVVKQVKDVDDKKLISIAWYWSTELTKNDSLPKLDEYQQLCLDSIIILDKGWMIRLNNKWISSNSDKKYKNVSIVNVDKHRVVAEVKIPTGKKVVELRCGSEAKVRYFS